MKVDAHCVTFSLRTLKLNKMKRKERKRKHIKEKVEEMQQRKG